MVNAIYPRLDQAEKRLLAELLESVAPDLLVLVVENRALSPGQRLWLEDSLDVCVQRVLAEDGTVTPEERALASLMAHIRQIQPVEMEKLEISRWKKGDPIPRGMERYVELGTDRAE